MNVPPKQGPILCPRLVVLHMICDYNRVPGPLQMTSHGSLMLQHFRISMFRDWILENVRT